jgi:hypothetical protein
MRPALRKSRPRHLAGSERTPWEPHQLAADFDVVAALDAEQDYDFDALFAGDAGADESPAPRVRAARHKIAFAVSVTIAALPFLVLDNFQATAESPDTSEVQAAAGAAKEQLRDAVRLPAEVASSEVPPVEVTIGKATVFVGEATTSTTAPAASAAEAPTTTVKATTTTAKPTTTTTAKPTTTTSTTAKAAVAGPVAPNPHDPNTWEKLAKCESGGNWQAVSTPRSGMQYYGGLQFSLATWQDMGGTGYPHEAPKATQIEMGKRLQARQGWKAWPTCARQLGWIA